MSDKEAVVIAGKIVDGMIADEIIANQTLIIANLNQQIETYKELDEVKKRNHQRSKRFDCLSGKWRKYAHEVMEETITLGYRNLFHSSHV